MFPCVGELRVLRKGIVSRSRMFFIVERHDFWMNEKALFKLLWDDSWIEWQTSYWVTKNTTLLSELVC